MTHKADMLVSIIKDSTFGALLIQAQEGRVNILNKKEGLKVSGVSVMKGYWTDGVVRYYPEDGWIEEATVTWRPITKDVTVATVDPTNFNVSTGKTKDCRMALREFYDLPPDAKEKFGPYLVNAKAMAWVVEEPVVEGKK